MKSGFLKALALSVICLLVLCSCVQGNILDNAEIKETKSITSIEEIPEFSGVPYIVINDNKPDFNEKDWSLKSYEKYSRLDKLGRCGRAEALIGIDIMPTAERGSIGQVKPSGWHTVKYDNVDGKYLYNRCHLIGYQLTGENANEKNLITGTRYLNIEGMLPFENMVADYVKETENHVFYRVTPYFVDSELLARGVQMEAISVEDKGEGICFNIFAYNAQPDITIDYENGESYLTKNGDKTEQEEKPDKEVDYILNINSKKFHKADCANAKTIKQKNKREYAGAREQLINQGYSPCQSCKP